MDGRVAARFVLEDDLAVDAEALQAVLFAQGAEGTWEHGGEQGGFNPRSNPDHGPLVVDAYFRDQQWCPSLTEALAEVATSFGCAFLGFELVLDQDWMEAHRKVAQPVVVGQFILDPREPDDLGESFTSELERQFLGPDLDLGHKARVIRVPLRRAFGGGSHQTTRLVMRQLQETEVRGKRVLDVGCGTGVLSFAAHYLGAEMVVGYDVDPVAAFIAVENRDLNQLGHDAAHFFAGTDAALARGCSFDLVMVNVLPERIRGTESSLCSHVALGGEVLLSGLLDSDAESSAQALQRWCSGGFVEVARRTEGEWLAVRLARRGAS